MQENKHELETLLSAIIHICNYRGCLVSKLVGGYSVFGRKVRTTNEVDNLISDAQKSLENSIVNPIPKRKVSETY
jgi:hypothetical protein